MKPTKLILLILFAFAFVQCSDDHAELLDVNGPLSRSITPIEESETNPTLLTDWENCEKVVLNKVGIAAKLPWGDGTSSSGLDSKFCKDIKSADGWTMLFHTFCKQNEDIGLSYMCLYNKFTGYLKVFYYSLEEDKGTSTVWLLKSDYNQTPQPLFADMEYFSQPLEGEKNYTIWSATADNHSAIRKGWNGFEFRVGEYQPTISTTDLKIDAMNTAYFEINLEGVTESTTNGTITAMNASPTLGGKAVEAVANVSGSKAKNLVDTLATKFLDKTFLGINFKDLITSVAVGDYASAFKSGLGAIFKGLYKTEPSVSEVKLQTNGTLSLSGDGTIKFSSTLSSLTFDLEKVLSSNSQTLSVTSIDSTNSIIPCYLATTDHSIRKAQGTELGVWNLKKKPTVYYDRYSKFENDSHFTEEELMGGMLDFIGMADYPNTNATLADNEVVFNPAIKDYVKSYSVNVSLIDVTGGNRVLNNKGKHIIEYNKFNQIKNDESRGITVYGVNSSDFFISGSIYNYPSNYINENTQYYLDWGENVGGNRAAVVTLTMDVDYNGKQMSFTESRVYDVEYKPRWLGQPVNNPPYSVVLNKTGNNLIGFDLPTMR